MWPSASTPGASVTMSLVTARCRSPPSDREPYSGAKLCFVPNIPVVMVTHSGWPVWSST